MRVYVNTKEVSETEFNMDKYFIEIQQYGDSINIKVSQQEGGDTITEILNGKTQSIRKMNFGFQRELFTWHADDMGRGKNGLIFNNGDEILIFIN